MTDLKINTSLKNWNKTPATCLGSVFPFIQSIIFFLFCPFYFCICFFLSILILCIMIQFVTSIIWVLWDPNHINSNQSWCDLIRLCQFLPNKSGLVVLIELHVYLVTLCVVLEFMQDLNLRVGKTWKTNQKLCKYNQSSKSKSIEMQCLWLTFLLGNCIIHMLKKRDWKIRVSVQGVKSLGSHFACLCRRFDFYEIKKKYYYFLKRKGKYLYTFNHFYSEKSSKREK